jgi:hypothetical protein
MITINRKVSSPTGGRLAIRNYQDTGEYLSNARLSRQKTLDGSCAFDHYGVTDCDRDLSITCRLSLGNISILRDVYEGGEEIRISYWDGVFDGYISRLSITRSGETNITFQFSEKLN